MNVICEQVESSYVLSKNKGMKIEDNAFSVFCKMNTVFNFLTIIYIQHYFVLVSGVQHIFYKMFSLLFPIHNCTIHSYYNIIDYLPYAVFCYCQLVLLNPVAFFT